jgi:hypothetical protein
MVMVSKAGAVILGVVVLSASGGSAASLPSGTISCSVSGTIGFRPAISNTAGGNVKVKITNKDGQSTCDSSGVTGGKEPISGVIIKLSGSLGQGATCETLSSTPQLASSKVKLKWRGLNPAGHLNTVALSKKTSVASVSWDSGSDALDIVTQPITFGGFTGSTITLHLGLDDFARFSSLCDSARILSTAFGNSNPSTVTVP